jgi:hypothetical protein
VGGGGFGACSSDSILDVVSDVDEDDSLSYSEGNIANPPGRDCGIGGDESGSGSGDDILSVIICVFLYLDNTTLCNAALVCTKWKAAALNPHTWCNFFAHTRDLENIYSHPHPYSHSHPHSHSQHPIHMHTLPPLRPCIDASGVLQGGLDSMLRLPRLSLISYIDMGQWKDDVDDLWVTNNMTHLTNLRHLSFRDCNKLSMSPPWIINFPNLVTLDLSTKVMGRLVTNDTLRDIAFLTKLFTLNLHYCEKITDVGIKYIASLPRLRDLDIGDCYKLGSVTISILEPLAKTLTRLSILSPVRTNSFLDDASVRQVVVLTSLRSLDIGWCTRVTDNGIRHFSSLTNLTYLGLAATLVSDDGIYSLRFCSKITGISISHCDNISTMGIAMLSQWGANLKAINLNGMPMGRTAAHNLQYLALMPHLEDLDFTNSYLDDSALLEDYFAKAPNLKRLSIGFNTLLTDESVRAATTAPNLQYYDLSHCPRLTDKALEYLATAPALKIVDISNIYGISQSALEKLRIRRPDLKIITQKQK